MSNSGISMPSGTYQFTDENSVRKKGEIKVSIESDDGKGRRVWVKDSGDYESVASYLDFAMNKLKTDFLDRYAQKLKQQKQA